jgi:hypothetical protein
MSENYPPIFIIGSERSGTNILQKLISNHTQVVGPKSPHFLNTFNRCSRYFGKLEDQENLDILIESLLSLANHKFTNWQFSIEKKVLVRESNSLIEIVDRIYKEYAKQNQKSTYVAKELNAHLYIRDILKVNPDARFIHIVRNPLEHTASWMRTPLFYLNPELVIKDWNKVQDEILELRYTFSNNIITVRYEDIVTSTKDTMTRILEFCGLEVQERCFVNEKVRKNDNWNKLWENVNKKVENDLNKHEDVLNRQEIDMIKLKTWSLTQELGYKIEKTNWSPTLLYRIQKFLRTNKSQRLRKKVKGKEITSERTNFGKELRKNIRLNYFKNEL